VKQALPGDNFPLGLREPVPRGNRGEADHVVIRILQEVHCLYSEIKQQVSTHCPMLSRVRIWCRRVGYPRNIDFFIRFEPKQTETRFVSVLFKSFSRN
jgi:hypothetical protein